MRFGISTHLYHHQHLTESHFGELAGSGFDAVELFATRSHFDYHDEAALDSLRVWLRATGMSLHSVHAPIAERNVDGRWLGPLSLAAPAEPDRARAVAETAAALAIARRVPYSCLVVHLGHTDPNPPPGSENSARAAIRSLEEVCTLAAPLGVRVAVEVIPNRLSSAEALVRLMEEELDLPDAGICLDFGHAALMGDLAEAIETVSGLMLTTHVHDNRGIADDHLAPFEGRVDWNAALMSLQKVGYDGTLLFEVACIDTAAAVLDRTRRARQRFETLMAAQAAAGPVSDGA